MHMIEEIIYQHRAEKEQLLAKEYIDRDGLEPARGFLDAAVIKTIIGPRRSGKSVFALLLLKNKRFAYLNSAGNGQSPGNQGNAPEPSCTLS